MLVARAVRSSVTALLCLFASVAVSAYDDRSMNEEEYFGARMQEHHQGQGLYQEPKGRGRYALLAGALAGLGVEWFWTGRSMKNTKKQQETESADFMKRWNQERDALMSRRTYTIKLLAHQVEDAELQLMQLVAAAEDAGVDVATIGGGLSGLGSAYQRSAQQDSLDYEEFKQPDVNGDNVISKHEFNQYIRKYLMMYPDTPEVDIPRFEDFDLNRDGLVTFDEWQYYLDQHRQADHYRDNELLRGMYDTSAQSQGFNSMAQNLNRAQGRGRY